MIILVAPEKVKFQLRPKPSLNDEWSKKKLFLNIFSTFNILIVNCGLEGVIYHYGYLYYFFILIQTHLYVNYI